MAARLGSARYRQAVRDSVDASFTTVSDDRITNEEALALYESVGWTAYTRDPLALRQALNNSPFVVCARDEHGELIGIV